MTSVDNIVWTILHAGIGQPRHTKEKTRRIAHFAHKSNGAHKSKLVTMRLAGALNIAKTRRIQGLAPKDGRQRQLGIANMELTRQPEDGV